MDKPAIAISFLVLSLIDPFRSYPCFVTPLKPNSTVFHPGKPYHFVALPLQIWYLINSTYKIRKTFPLQDRSLSRSFLQSMHVYNFP